MITLFIRVPCDVLGRGFRRCFLLNAGNEKYQLTTVKVVNAAGCRILLFKLELSYPTIILRSINIALYVKYLVYSNRRNQPPRAGSQVAKRSSPLSLPL